MCTTSPLPLQKAMDVENTMHEGMFQSRTPATGRSSICAAQALVHLFENERFALAGNMWHVVCLLPHTLVRCKDDVYLVMAQGRYAARAWKATELKPVVEATCSPLATGVEERLRSRWGFNTAVDWEWLFTEDIHDWYYIDVAWVANLESPERYGFVAAEETHSRDAHVPAVIEAMVRRGPHKIRQSDRKALIKIASEDGKKDGTAQQMTELERELHVLERLMHGHPRVEEYKKRLKMASVREKKEDESAHKGAM